MFKTISEEKIKKLLQLCELNEDGLYYSKKGNDYINAIKTFLNSKNKNDNPFTEADILKQPKLDDFKFKGLKDFQYVCQLYAKPMIINLKELKKENEKILYDNIPCEHQTLFFNTLGIVYLITCKINKKEYIIKIGSTRTTFGDRLNSYNCGVITNLRSASTTNIKIVQSFITTRKHFNLYLLDCSDENKYFKWYEKKSVTFASSKALAYEDILLKEFKNQFGTTPLANVQANATQLKNKY